MNLTRVSSKFFDQLKNSFQISALPKLLAEMIQLRTANSDAGKMIE